MLLQRLWLDAWTNVERVRVEVFVGNALVGTSTSDGDHCQRRHKRVY